MKKRFVIEAEGAPTALIRLPALVALALKERALSFERSANNLEALVSDDVRCGWFDNAEALRSAAARIKVGED